MKSYKPPAFFKHGRYIPQKVLGTGTYGQVLLCKDQLMGNDVAIKVAQCDPAYRRSALNEIYALQTLLDNADSVQLLDTFEDDRHMCIVMELLDKNLFELLRGRGFGPLSIPDVRKVARHVLGALTALHNAGFIHCDIKPENIMLRKSSNTVAMTNSALKPNSVQALQGVPYTSIQSDINSENDNCQCNGQDDAKRDIFSMSLESTEPSMDFNHTCLIDFGAVRQFHENTYYDIQSLWYRAPEVLCGLPYTPLIDSWSVGCLLFELYTGKALFPGENTADQFTRIVQLTGYPSQRALTLGKNMNQLKLPLVSTNSEIMETHLQQWIKTCRQSGLQRYQSHLYQQNLRQQEQQKQRPLKHLGAVNLQQATPTPYGSIEGSFFDSEVNSNNQSTIAEEDFLINLIISLLQPDECRRLSCADALLHPFLCCPASPHVSVSYPFVSPTPRQHSPTTASVNLNALPSVSHPGQQAMIGFLPNEAASQSTTTCRTPMNPTMQTFAFNLHQPLPAQQTVPVFSAPGSTGAGGSYSTFPDATISQTCMVPLRTKPCASSAAVGSSSSTHFSATPLSAQPKAKMLYHVPMIQHSPDLLFHGIVTHPPTQQPLIAPLYLSIASQQVLPAATHTDMCRASTFNEPRRFAFREARSNRFMVYSYNAQQVMVPHVATVVALP